MSDQNLSMFDQQELWIFFDFFLKVCTSVRPNVMRRRAPDVSMARERYGVDRRNYLLSFLAFICILHFNGLHCINVLTLLK